MKRTTTVLVLLTFTTALISGCASEYTILDRSSLVISDNARVSAASVLPGGAVKPRTINHFALAQEVQELSNGYATRFLNNLAIWLLPSY